MIAEGTADDPRESDTVIRLLDREAEIETSYGGGFVQSIEGLSGGVEDGRSFDWFFYVNGIESSVGSADVPVRAGDRIWWDYREWSEAMRVPAVVGSWPEPLAQATAGIETEPVRIECAGTRAACDEVADRLSDEGADAAIERFQPGGEGPPAYRVLVGPWERLRGDPAADILEGGPAQSGVFADFVSRGGEWELVALDARGRAVERVGAGGGVVAALRDGEDPPVWVVTGSDRDGVEHAVELLSAEALRDRYAVASAGEAPIPLPAGGAP